MPLGENVFGQFQTQQKRYLVDQNAVSSWEWLCVPIWVVMFGDLAPAAWGRIFSDLVCGKLSNI